MIAIFRAVRRCRRATTAGSSAEAPRAVRLQNPSGCPANAQIKTVQLASRSMVANQNVCRPEDILPYLPTLLLPNRLDEQVMSEGLAPPMPGGANHAVQE